MVEYKLQNSIADNHGRISYGIEVLKNNTSIACVKDISTDKSEVEKLIVKFNTYELSPCHLHQAVEDYLYDQNID